MSATIRDDIAQAILKAQWNDNATRRGPAPDPDFAHAAADFVVAVLVERFTGQPCVTVFPEGVIGAAAFELASVVAA